MIREPAHTPASRAGSIVTAALFALMLLAPAALALAGRAGADANFVYYTEMRRPFNAPPLTAGALATGGWMRDLERQIGDAFPLRTPMIVGYDALKYRALDDVASVHVVRGRDGWLFLGDEERAYDDGSFAPPDAVLGRVADAYASRARWCAARGITYVFLLVPNKSTVYARFLPAWARHVEPNAGERLLPMLRARGVRAVYPRQQLIDESFRSDVYQRGDTHWNDTGAYVAYRALVAATRDAGVRDAIERRTLRPRVEPAVGDLDRFAGVASWLPNDTIRDEFAARAHDAGSPSYPNDAYGANFQRSAYEVAGARLPTALVFGDSFSVALKRFVAEDFRRTVALQYEISGPQSFDRVAVETEHPRVVIEELVERALPFAVNRAEGERPGATVPER